MNTARRDFLTAATALGFVGLGNIMTAAEVESHVSPTCGP